MGGRRRAWEISPRVSRPSRVVWAATARNANLPPAAARRPCCSRSDSGVVARSLFVPGGPGPQAQQQRGRARPRPAWESEVRPRAVPAGSRPKRPEPTGPLVADAARPPRRPVRSALVGAQFFFL